MNFRMRIVAILVLRLSDISVLNYLSRIISLKIKSLFEMKLRKNGESFASSASVNKEIILC